MPAPGDPIEAVAARLTAESPLTAIVQERSFPNKPKENASLPYVTFWVASGGGGSRLNSDRGLKSYDIRAEATATTEDEVKTVMLAVRDRLHHWRDRANGVQGCFAQEDFDERVNDDQTQSAGQTYTLMFCPQ